MFKPFTAAQPHLRPRSAEAADEGHLAPRWDRSWWWYLGSVWLIFLPVPVGPGRRYLVGVHRPRGDGEDQYLFTFPDLICTAHLIWFGWAVTLVHGYNRFAAGFGPTIPESLFNSLWWVVLICTILMMGLRFNVGGAMLALVTLAALVIVVLAIHLPGFWWRSIGLDVRFAVTALRDWVDTSWTLPLSVSLALGVTVAVVVAWNTVNETWLLPHDEDNIVTNRIWSQSDTKSRTLAALNFETQHPCMLRKYVLFGYGNIVIRLANQSHQGTLRGVFHASDRASDMRQRTHTLRQRKEAARRTGIRLHAAAADEQEAADTEMQVAEELIADTGVDSFDDGDTNADGLESENWFDELDDDTGAA